jgi:hypothetical protein
MFVKPREFTANCESEPKPGSTNQVAFSVAGIVQTEERAGMNRLMLALIVAGVVVLIAAFVIAFFSF